MPTTPELDRKLNGAETGKSVASSEEDPCIEESKDTKLSFRDQTEKKLREKSGLSRKGLLIAAAVLFVLLLLFIIVIALGAAWPRIPHHNQFPVCENSACLRAAAQIRESLNTSASSCTDIWGWVCGGWLKNNPLPRERSLWNQKEQLRVQEASRIRELISTLPLPVLAGTVQWKLKHLYESCMEIDNIDADGVRPLERIIHELGGWHILRDWNMYSWDYKRVLKRLHSEYGVTPFFKITVEPNPRWPANNSIRISPSGIGLPEREFYYADPEDKLSTAYKRLLRDIVSKLRATSNDAIKFSTDLFYYEKRIAEITPDSIFLRNPINTHNIITVSELKITAASLPLRDILVSMFPNAGITDETEILVSSPDYLTAVSGIVSNSDRSSLNDYLIWCLVKEYLPFLSTEYTAEYQQYISELTGVHAPIERWETCIKIVKKFMGVAVHALLENNVPLTQASSKIVKNMFNNLRNAALQHINEQNFPSEYRRHIIQKTTGLAIKIGFPKNVSTDEYLVNYYLKLYVQKSNLFQNVWNGFTFLRNEQQQRYLEPQSEYRLIRFSTSQSFNVGYLGPSNTVVVPRELVSAPYFDSNYPRSIIYGRLGIEIATAIVSSILPYDSSWSRNEGLLSSYHLVGNQSLKVANAPQICLSQFVTRNKFATEEIAQLTSLSTLKHVTALRLADTALRKELEYADHVHQPALEIYEDDALFYISYAQTKCGRYTEQQELLDNSVDFKLSDKILLKVSWSQVPKFATALECTPHSGCSDIL